MLEVNKIVERLLCSAPVGGILFDDQHRYRGGTKHRFGNTAHHQTFQATATVGANNDQVSKPFICLPENHIDRSAPDDFDIDMQTRLFFVEKHFDVMRWHGGNIALGRFGIAQERLLFDMQKPELCIDTLCQSDSIPNRFV
jgi:hypothetical protein